MGEAKGKTSTGMDQNVEALLCYVGWWLTGLIFYLIEKENQYVRFHAMQSILVFGAISVAQIILSFIPVIGWGVNLLVWILSIILWVLLMMNAYQGKRTKMPIAGDIAEKNSAPPKTS